VDFATTATPAQVKKMLKKARVWTVNKNGEAHGTITAYIEGSLFEITTLLSVDPHTYLPSLPSDFSFL